MSLEQLCILFHSDNFTYTTVVQCYVVLRETEKISFSISILSYYHNPCYLFPTAIITNSCNIFKTPILASLSLTILSFQAMLSNTLCLQDFFELTRTSSPNLHHTLVTSSPSLSSLDSKHIIIITSPHKFSKFLFLLIFSWRNPNSQLNSLLCLFCTSNEEAEIWSRKKFFKKKQTA